MDLTYSVPKEIPAKKLRFPLTVLAENFIMEQEYG
jgi:hypothetical protein